MIAREKKSITSTIPDELSLSSQPDPRSPRHKNNVYAPQHTVALDPPSLSLTFFLSRCDWCHLVAVMLELLGFRALNNTSGTHRLLVEMVKRKLDRKLDSWGRTKRARGKTSREKSSPWSFNAARSSFVCLCSADFSKRFVFLFFLIFFFLFLLCLLLIYTFSLFLYISLLPYFVFLLCCPLFSPHLAPLSPSLSVSSLSLFSISTFSTSLVPLPSPFSFSSSSPHHSLFFWRLVSQLDLWNHNLLQNQLVRVWAHDWWRGAGSYKGIQTTSLYQIYYF